MASNKPESSSASFSIKRPSKHHHDIITADEVANFFAGNALDRCSHLRKDPNFLQSAVIDSSTKFVVFENLKPLSCKSSETRRLNLKPVSGEDLHEYFGNKLTNLEELVFLGQDLDLEPEGNLENPQRCSWFAINIKDNEISGLLIEKMSDVNKDNVQELAFIPPFPGLTQFQTKEASIAAQARAILAWHQSHLYCPCCGMKTIIAEGGYKRECSNESCDSNKGWLMKVYDTVKSYSTKYKGSMVSE